MKSIEVFRGRTPNIIGKRSEYAVMVLIINEDGEEKIILEKRAMTLKSQPGDICLPGGYIEKNETPEKAAIRETMEELLLKKEEIELIGPMDYFISPYGQTMYPFVARTYRTEFIPSKDEVDHLIKIPIRFFMNHTPLIYEVDLSGSMGEDFPYHLIEQGKNYPFRRAKFKQYFYRYEEYVVWGFTAQIIKSFIDILREDE